MSTTSEMPSNREWLRRLVSGKPHQVITHRDGAPYLRRWYVIPRNRFLNVYLHQFVTSDDDRAPHDHPWPFVSLILKGGYNEVTPQCTKRRHAGSIAFRPAKWRHRVELLPDVAYETEAPCWTLIVTGRRTRAWGFWCKQQSPFLQRRAGDRFVPWTEFDAVGCGETS